MKDDQIKTFETNKLEYNMHLLCDVPINSKVIYLLVNNRFKERLFVQIKPGLLDYFAKKISSR
jgi:hypothetical protein